MRPSASQVTKISVDLSHRDKAIASLAKCKDATHLFFCAYQSTGSFSKDVAVNVSMFTNMIEAAEAAGCKLQHVHFVSGTKWYGASTEPRLSATLFKSQRGTNSASIPG